MSHNICANHIFVIDIVVSINPNKSIDHYWYVNECNFEYSLNRRYTQILTKIQESKLHIISTKKINNIEINY